VVKKPTDTPKIVAFCCHYAAGVPQETLSEAGLLPEGFKMERLPCTGRLEIPAMLEAFEQGAEAVMVAGCRLDECHNLSGSKRAARRVGVVRNILTELNVDPGRIEMIFVARGETESIVEAARKIASRVSAMGLLHHG